jgi:hypothetical protein
MKSFDISKEIILKNALKIAGIIIFVVFIYFISFIFPKMERDITEKKILIQLEKDQKNVERKIVFSKNGKTLALKYICEIPKTQKSDSVLPEAFLIVIAKRMAIDYKISDNDLADYLKNHPALINLWLAESGKPVSELFSTYFSTSSFYYENGYYYVSFPHPEDNPTLKSTKENILCSKYIVKVCGLDENVSANNIYFDFNTSFKRQKFRIMFKKQGFDYIFGNADIQEQLFGRVLENTENDRGQTSDR